MTMILQSNGSLDKWLSSEYATLVRNDKKLSPLEKYEKLLEDKEALGMIRLYLSEPLQKLTEGIETTVEIWQLLKTKSTIINSEAIEYLERSLWALKVDNLADAENHIQQFNEIIAQLRDNNVQHQESVLVSAALKAWPKVIDTQKQIMQATNGITLQAVQDKLRTLALTHIMQSATEDLETKIAHAAIQVHEEQKSSRDKRRPGPRHIRDFQNLLEVPTSSIDEWERHINPGHTCQYGKRCWFNAAFVPNRPPIIRKFLQSRGILKGNPSEDDHDSRDKRK
jgi:soluble cytochrome b562